EPAAAEPAMASPAAEAPRRQAPLVAQPSVAPPPTPASGGLRGLFQTVTGRAGPSALLKRTLTEPTPPPVAPRVEPTPVRAQPRPSPEAEVGLEIPTFLRRQSN
ncbi:cell division protein FtsZ, partial [Siccirubricoccus sp. KC 17139]|nr:cell division protein FtsZ [Siccirubricoccus soli]MCP2684695.1 cell division protein FtsZ [Siccirubricoccus soli]